MMKYCYLRFHFPKKFIKIVLIVNIICNCCYIYAYYDFFKKNKKSRQEFNHGENYFISLIVIICNYKKYFERC